MRLHVHEWGRGPRVVLVHGGVLGGRETWRAQRPLSERRTLLAPDRPGHGQSPPARQDFKQERVDVRRCPASENVDEFRGVTRALIESDLDPGSPARPVGDGRCAADATISSRKLLSSTRCWRVF